MPEINLLQNRKRPSRISLERAEVSSRALPVVMLILLVLVLVAYGGFIYFKKQVQAEVLSVEAQTAELDEVISSKQNDISKAVNAQSRLRLFENLLEQHVRWTNVWSELGEQTYKLANYFTVEAAVETNKMNLSGFVPSYTDLGKLLLGLGMSEHFENVELQSAGPAEEDKLGVNFEIVIVVKPDILYGLAEEQ